MPAACCLRVLPTAYCLLPTAYCLLPIAYIAHFPYCLLPTAYTAYCLYCLYCLLPTAYCLLPATAYCPLPTAYVLPTVAYCLLPTVLHIMHRLLPDATIPASVLYLLPTTVPTLDATSTYTTVLQHKSTSTKPAERTPRPALM